MKRILLLAALSLATQAHANILHFDNLAKGWSAQPVTEADAAAAHDADAILNYREGAKPVEATVYVTEYPMPDEKLGGDKLAWRKFMFPGPADASVKILLEGTIHVNGQWRYILHFETETGTNLHSFTMATVVNGKLQIFLIEHNQRLIEKYEQQILELYKTVAIRSTSH